VRQKQALHIGDFKRFARRRRSSPIAGSIAREMLWIKGWIQCARLGFFLRVSIEMSKRSRHLIRRGLIWNKTTIAAEFLHIRESARSNDRLSL